MKALYLVCALFTLTLVFFIRSGGEHSHRAEAALPAAVLSEDLIFQCLPDGSLRAGLRWTTTGLGPQWLDVSLFDNGFAPGSFIGFGPLPPDASGLLQDGFLPGMWHFARVNTLTPEGWVPSLTMFFLTPADCPVLPPAQTTLPPPTPCLLSLPAAGLSACLWTERPDFASYGRGELLHYCYNLNQATDVLIVATRPDGSTVVVLDGFVNATGACIGPFQAAEPLGLRTARLYGGRERRLLAETHFVVE